MDLKHTLARKSPDPGFADRVMARIAAEERLAPGAGRLDQQRSVFTRRQASGARRFFQAVAATLLLTALGGGYAAQKAIERREGERAKDEVMLALRIAGAKVRHAQQQVRDIGAH